MSSRKKTVLDPAIKHVPLGELVVFQITEGELEALERGTGESLFLNFAVSMLSVAVSLSVSLASATFSSDRLFYVFAIVMSACILGAVICGLLWFTSRKSARSVAGTIRARIPPDGEQAADE